MKLKNRNRKIVLALALCAIVLAIILLEKTTPNFTGSANKTEVQTPNTAIANLKSAQYPKAIEFVNPDGFVNTNNQSIKLSDYIGKDVILLDFWDASCINCQRTIPYLESWYKKYKSKGLVIVGIHSPEFNFEKSLSYVQSQTQRFGVTYPVVLDNEFQTWHAYGNQYWPHEYLIDIDGFIVHDHIGEGGYNGTEQIIQSLLKERAQRLGLNESIDSKITQPEINATDFSGIQSPEIYFGYGYYRGQMGNAEGYVPGSIVTYAIPKNTAENKFYLEGGWRNNNDNMEAVTDSEILLKYYSKDVNIVAGSDKEIQVSIYIDGKFEHNVTISGYQLYNIYSGKDYGGHEIEIKTPSGLKAYTFTFG